MKRCFATMLVLATTATSLVVARAGAQEGDAPHRALGLGFHRSSVPIGFRWWVGPTVGIDLGLNVGANRVSTSVDTDGNLVPDLEVEDTVLSWAVEAGVPWTLWRWQGVRTSLRPGFGYSSEDDATTFLDTGVLSKRKTFLASGEIEVELFIGKNVSLSASHGLEYRNTKLDGAGSSQWTLESTGNDFATLGFHVYLFGPDVK